MGGGEELWLVELLSTWLSCVSRKPRWGSESDAAACTAGPASLSLGDRPPLGFLVAALEALLAPGWPVLWRMLGWSK